MKSLRKPERRRFYATIGHRIKLARLKAGISQETLAKQIGLSRTSLVNIEQGRHRIQLHMAFNVALILGVQVSDLIPARRSGIRK